MSATEEWNTEAAQAETSRRVILDADLNVAIARIRDALTGNPASKTFERLLVFLERENSALALASHRHAQRADRADKLFHSILELGADMARRLDEQENTFAAQIREAQRTIARLSQPDPALAANATISATTPEKSADAK